MLQEAGNFIQLLNSSRGGKYGRGYDLTSEISAFDFAFTSLTDGITQPFPTAIYAASGPEIADI